jgi:hypothetical protein
MSLLATAKLEGLSIKKGLTTFGLKTKLYIKATKSSTYSLETDASFNCVTSVNNYK